MLNIKINNASKIIISLNKYNYIEVVGKTLIIVYAFNDKLAINFDNPKNALLAQKKIELILANHNEGFFILENIQFEESNQKPYDIVLNVNDYIIEGIIYSCRHLVSVTKDNKTAIDIMKTSGFSKSEFTKANNKFKNFFNQREHLQDVIDNNL